MNDNDKQIYNNPAIRQILRGYRRPREYLPIAARFAGDCFQMDIMVYTRFEYNGYKHILTCIDVYSRYAQAVPLKSRNQTEVVPAIQHIIEDLMKTIPVHLNVDDELSSITKLQEYYTRNGIKVYTSSSGEPNKNAIVERFHRTLASFLMEYRLASDNEDWPSYLPLVIDYYNNKHIHHTTHNKPSDLYFGNKILNYDPVSLFITKRSELPNTYKVGDYVFILTDKDRFAKGDIGNIGLYRVTNVNGYKVYLEMIMPDGTSIPMNRHYKPYELEHVNENTVNFIHNNSVYNRLVKAKLENIAKRKQLKHEADIRESKRRTLKNQIARAKEKGDYETVKKLEGELAKLTRRELKSKLSPTEYI